ncbi:MAG: hypothetical protein K6B46_02635 [Opitutales bacterium]|nr:hypothetical protein [Opitutales bacterium]
MAYFYWLIVINNKPLFEDQVRLAQNEQGKSVLSFYTFSKKNERTFLERPATLQRISVEHFEITLKKSIFYNVGFLRQPNVSFG